LLKSRPRKIIRFELFQVPPRWLFQNRNRQRFSSAEDEPVIEQSRHGAAVMKLMENLISKNPPILVTGR
jgi:hypothetical protein